MVEKLEFAGPVPRWLRIRSGEDEDDPPFELDDDGFLPDPTSSGATSSRTAMLRPDEALSRGALVLLGEPGAGKTTTFALLTGSGQDAAEPEPGKPGTVWVTGSELSATGVFTDAFGDHLAALPPAGAAEPPAGTLTIVLDQLDEAANVHRLPGRLKRALQNKDTRSLRFLIACRTADYPEGLTQVLGQALKECIVADLAPLTRDDVVTLAAGTGTDAATFIDAVTKSGVGMLANLPLTLKVLLAAFQRDPNSLTQGPRELFELGVKRLADEHDRQRAADSFTVTTVEQRLVIASRIATRMLLSGQRTIWCGEYAQSSPDDITEGMLSGGRENWSGDFDVTPAAVGETLKTALFSRSGRNRIAFAHSSFAAFLTARYLKTRMSGTSDVLRSLSGVFLVAAPDEATASIPIHLRETAAWLIAHAPEDYRWLATADPEGLIAHGAYITDADTRAAMVDGLLRRAAEVELSDRAWHRTWWRLTHPGLAAQLKTVLARVLAVGSDEWQDFAAASLAIRLARDSAVADVTDLLLEVAGAQNLLPALRYSAVKAAMTTDPVVAAPRLRDLLATLTTENDPDDESEELVGTILSVLWPADLDLADVLPHIHPIRNKAMLGMYRWQLRQLPSMVEEVEVSALLNFGAQLVDRILAPPGGVDASEPVQYHPDLSDSPSLDELLTPIFDRATLSPNLDEHLPVLVRQLSRLLFASATLTMPAGADLIDASGYETAASRRVRRSLAEALIVECVATCNTLDRYHVYMVTSHWAAVRNGRGTIRGLRRGARARLLDDADFAWLLDRVDEYRARGAAQQADALGLVAASIADLYNQATFELAYMRRDTPEAKHFGWMFDGVELNGALAKAMRVNTSHEQVWEYADTFAKRQSERLEAAAGGNTDAFWQLARYLKADPATGNFGASDSYDPRALPGAGLWPAEEFVGAFSIAARRFLQVEHDHRAEWLGAQIRDYRAEAGYSALIVLHDRGDLDDMADRWGAWIGVVLDKAHRVEAPTESPVIRELMYRAVTHAPDELAAAIRQLVGATLSRGEAPWALSAIVSLLPIQLHPALVELAAEVRAAVDEHVVDVSTEEPTGVEVDHPTAALELSTLPATVEARDAAIRAWTDLLREPVVARNIIALEQAEHALVVDETDGGQTRFAIPAGRLLLTADAGRTWPRIRTAVAASSEFSHNLAVACASTHHINSVADSLSDDELAEVWRWLAEVFPPSADVWQDGFVGPDRSVHDWRNALLTALSLRGTPRSVFCIRGLADTFPEDLRIRSALISARRRAQARATVLLNPQQVIDLLADPDRRVIRTAVQLAELVIDTITEIDRDLPSHSNLLWDCEREPLPPGSPSGTHRTLVWRPKPEGTLAAYIAHELDIRLVRRAVVINREVVIKPTGAGDSGERPDILVEAVTFDLDLDAATTVSVPVEIKGSWHEAVLTAQRTQLADRYLPAAKTDTGVYLVGWYPIDQWSAQDGSRRSKAAKLPEPDTLLTTLQDQAATILAEQGKRTLPSVLRTARAAPHADSG